MSPHRRRIDPVLDPGRGTGHLTGRLEEAGATTVGVDDAHDRLLEDL